MNTPIREVAKRAGVSRDTVRRAAWRDGVLTPLLVGRARVDVVPSEWADEYVTTLVYQRTLLDRQPDPTLWVEKE